MRLDGRTMEIQRLIGRALRSVMDLKSQGESAIWTGCSVIQADGGNRTTSITGAFVALVDAVNSVHKNKAQKDCLITDCLWIGKGEAK